MKPAGKNPAKRPTIQPDRQTASLAVSKPGGQPARQTARKQIARR